MTTGAARPIASLALTLALALLAVLGGLVTSFEAANADPSCEVPPTGLASALNDAGSGILLTWEVSSCTPDEYALYRRNMDEDGSRMRLFATVDGATLSYTDTSVDAGVTYRYRIRSNDKGPRSASTELTVPVPKSDAGDTETSGETPRHHGGVNSEPAFGITSATRDMLENSPAETNVDSPVEAIDPDAGDTLTYSLSGADASSFTFDSSTGQIKTKAGVIYNHEAKSSYSVSVSVRDSKDAAGHADTLVDDIIEVTVTVGDVDEPGTLVLSHSVPRVGSVQRARLNEDDAGVSDPTWRWHQSADQQTWSRIQGSDSHHFEPGSSLEGLYLRARARYRDKHGPGKTVEAITTEPVAAAETAPTITVVELITGLSIPWGIAFAPDGTMLFTERLGVLSSRLTDGTLQAVTADLKDLFVDAEMGLMGIVVDPEFASNRRFYTCQSYRLDPPPLNPRHIEMRVVAWTINASYTEATRVSDPLVEGIPFGNRNTGCRLRFGPDGYLWVTTGDAGGETNAQDLTSLAGKVLRVDASTGAAAPGNPFAPSLVYSYGHRNPQGLALRPGTRQMWSVEHGPSQDDEINLVVSGANYGWQSAPNTYDEGVMTDLQQFPDAMEARWSSGANTIATSGGIFLDGDDWGIWEGRLAVASLKNESLRLFEFDADGVLLSEHVVGELKNAYGRLRTPMVAPNGALYVSTSAGGGSDKILLVAPSQPPSFSSDSVTLDVQENSAAPTVVGTVTATDPEGRTLTYTLSGPDADAFDIPNPSAGQLQARESFDRETKDSYEVVIKATDNYGLSDSVTVTIEVTNVNEAPVVSGNNSPDFPEIEFDVDGASLTTANLTVPGAYTFYDDDKDDVTWGLSGADADHFTITKNANGNGVLTFRNPSPTTSLKPADFENPVDGSTPPDNMYEIIVKATDASPQQNTREFPVTVTVTNVEEAGTVTIAGTPSGGEQLTATVADGDGPVSNLTWQWARGSTVTFDNITGATSDSYTPVATDVAQYLKVTASYTDALPGRKTASAVTSSAVEASNAEPAFAEGPSATRTVAENSPQGTDVEGPVMATDSDNDTLTYSLSDRNLGSLDAESFQVDSSTGQIRTVFGVDYDFEEKDRYLLTLSVHDSKDAAGNPDPTSDATIAVTITLENVDEPGTVGILSLTDTNGRQLLRSTELTDPDGSVNISRTTWSRGDTAGGPFIEVARDLAEYHTVVADVDKYIELSISYGDGEGPGKTVSAVTAGQIAATNSDPMFDAGAPTTLSVAENSTAGTSVGAALTASDADNDDLTYSLDGPDARSFEIDSIGQIKTRSGITYNFESAKNTYNVTVNVHDGKDIASVVDDTIDDTIDVAITLTDANDAPTITGGVTTKTISENSTAVAAYMASDVDAGDTLTWSKESADDGAFFQISSSGELSFISAPDFETKEDAGDDNDYEVTVKVTDAGDLSATLPVTVTVADVNEAPTIDGGSASFAVDENTETTTIVQTYKASDTDAGTNLRWTLEGDDEGAFTITKNTSTGDGELRFRNVPNHEMPADTVPPGQTEGDNVYDITVKVADAGRLSATLPVTVTVNDLNETPVVSGNNSPDFPEIEFDVDGASLTKANLTVPGAYTFYDDDRDDVTWGLSGADAKHFTITKDANGNGVLTFKNPSPTTSLKPADFENPVDGSTPPDNMYEIIVKATDASPQQNTREFPVTVTVTNVDETPEITTTGATHATPSFAEIEYDATTADLTVADYDARDEEGEAITWSHSGPDMIDFTIDSTTGVLSFAIGADAIGPDYEISHDSSPHDNVYTIIVKATDASPTRKAREYPVNVTVTDVNETPEVTLLRGDSAFPETSYDSDQRPEVATFMARDEEGQDITFTLGEDDGDAFTITKDAFANVAVVTFTDPPDYEMPADDDSRNTYAFTVEAFDGTNTGTWDYTLTVTDVNERPEFTGTIETTFVLDEHDANEIYTFPVLASYTARDEEGGVTWSLTGTGGGDFAIDDDGAVTFAAAPSFETPADSNPDNVYTFKVVATDVKSGSSRLTATVDITVTVEDIEEAGTIEVDNLNPAVGDLITFELMDPDGGIDVSPGGGFRWSIQGRLPGAAWGTIPTSTPRSTTGAYRADEDHTGFEIRAVANYGDRRGPGKSAESMATAAVAADPIINAPPRFQTGGTQRIAEVGAGVDVGERLTASDRENDPLTWGISGGPAAVYFAIDASSGQLRTIEAWDFETTVVTRPFILQVTLHDGRDADGNPDSSVDVTTAIEFEIIDVEELGVVTLSLDEPEVGDTVVATLEDGDGSIQGVSWQWARSENGRTGWVNISRATSSSYTTLRSDAGSFLRARVTYADNRGGGKTAEAVTANGVFSENEGATFPSSEDGQRAVPENTPARVNIGTPVAATDLEDDSLRYALSGPDAAAFTVVASSGQLRTSGALDFETQPSYSFTIEVHDGRDGSGNPSTMVDDSRSVTVTVENVEELGTVTLTTDTATIQARVEVTAELSDDDGPSDVTWQWSRSPNGRTNWVNIASATSATYTPTLEEDAGNYIRATATYTDGHGPNKTANAVSPRVGDPPPANSPPAFPATEDGQRDVPEDAATGQDIGGPVVASDLNNDDLTYSLSGTASALFTIDEDTGQLRLASNAQLDFEEQRSHRVVVSVSDGADRNHDPDTVIDDTINVVITVTDVNEAPVITGDTSPSLPENASTPVATFTGADPERDTLAWSVDNSDFWISSRGQLYFFTPPSFEGGSTTHGVTVSAADDGGQSATLAVSVSVTDMEEEGVVTVTPPRGWADVATRFSAELTDDDGGETGIDWRWERSPNGRSGWVDIAGATSSSYTADAGDVGAYLRATAFYEDRRGSNKTAQSAPTGRVDELRPATNSAPAFGDTGTRSIAQGTAAGRAIGVPVQTTDEDTDDVLTYSLSGVDGDHFDIGRTSGQLRTKAVLDPQVQRIYAVTVSVHDGFDASYNPSEVEDDSTDVTITATEVSTPVFGGGGGGGGGRPSGPSPSVVDFEWTVKHDLEALDESNGIPTGLWGRDGTLWVAQNGDGANDGVYAYDLETGERAEEREFELDERNRAPRGIWSEGETAWVSDSGQDKLFAYDLASGERLPNRDIAFDARNRDARAIWSGGETMWVLDGGKDSLFAYDLESGELLAEYSLDSTNGDPRGLWSDGVAIWVSDHGAKRLFAYRLPAPPAAEEDAQEEAPALERVRDEEFGELSGASNNSPRGIWSDGDVMYVADESDDRVYTYNMPDAIDARLASLTLSGVDIGEFSPKHAEYEAAAGEGVTETTVTAEAMQRRTSIAIDPPDADGDKANGYQVTLDGIEEITVTVTSADGSRTKVYRVRFEAATEEIALSPAWTLVEWGGREGADIAAALEEGGLTERVTVIYEWDEVEERWRPYFPGLQDVPGLNTLSSLRQGRRYWVAVTEPVTWTVTAP